MENIKVIAIGIVCLFVGGYLFNKERKGLKAMKNKDMLWATKINLYQLSFLILLIGFIAVISSVYKLFF